MRLLCFRICDGSKDPKVVLQNQIQKYREVFRKAVEQVIIDYFFSIDFWCKGLSHFGLEKGYKIKLKFLVKKSKNFDIGNVNGTHTILDYEITCKKSPPNDVLPLVVTRGDFQFLM